MTMRGKDRAALRGEANGLSATVHGGPQGVAPSLIHSLDDALRTRELVKVQLSKHAELKPKEVARELADATHSEVVQVIGRTATFYRHNPELKRKDDTPPWRV
jgi:RNA-binding protein